MEIEVVDSRKFVSKFMPARYIFVILGCLASVNVYSMRVNLSVALVAMVNRSSLIKSHNVTSDCGHTADNETQLLEENGEFVWDETTQGFVLGSYFWGCIFTQIPGGRLAEIFSGKWLLGGGVLITAILTLLTPIAARLGVGYLIAVRVLEGLCVGVTFPSMQCMISQWAPINERNRFVSIIFAGGLLGTVLGLSLSSYLCVHGFAGGWPSAFYVFGAFAIVWFILWAALVYDSPECHPWITNEEKRYILRGVTKIDKEKDKLPLPWKEMMKSLPLWAIVAAHFGNNWGFYTFLTELPTYLKTVLNFDMKSNGMFSALPYFLCWVCSLLVSYFCDKLAERDYIQLTAARKIFNSIGLLVPAALLIGLTFVHCDSSTSYALLVVAMGINSFIYVGYQGNHIDIASNFAGTLYGITNCIAIIPGMIGPLIIGALIQDNPSHGQWAKVFYITATIYSLGAVFYIIFGSAEEQYWNKVKQEKKSCIENNVDETKDLL